MTAAQRATLEIVLASAREDDPADVVPSYGYEQAGTVADALRAALGTCGTCRWLVDGLCLPEDRNHPSYQQGRPMAITRPDWFGCTGYTPKEGA
jgi:hypothetical protein